MSLEKEINDGIKAAMLAKEKVRLAGLRAVKAEILLAKTADGSDEISDGAVLKIIQKLVKQRKESAAVYIAQVGAASPADMGKVMGVATKQLAGQADGRAISEAVKKLLQ